MKKKTGIVILMIIAMSVTLAVGALAATQTSIAPVLESTFQGIVNEIITIILIVLPIALGVLGLTMAIKFGVVYFKELAGRSK